ncbi:MAG: hypothetical protein MI924_18485 [Chloroflexales bacterium]|nr:hypothetical protein [Chloroflexales bacterium]
MTDDDGVLLEQIAERLGSSSLVKRNIAPLTTAEKPKALLRVDSTRLINNLIAVGIPLGPKSGQEPFLEFSTARLTWSFIRGVFDVDGCIRVYERSNVIKGKLYGPYRRARWSITCGTPFAQGLRSFLINQNIKLNARCIQAKQGTGLIEISNQDVIHRIRDEMYRYSSFVVATEKDNL